MSTDKLPNIQETIGKKYDNFISLGFFCSVALELERIGLRSVSSPFDWCISDFEGVVSAIENSFEGFLDYDLLQQSDSVRSHYYNKRYKIWFFHDFDKYMPLNKQLPGVVDKYSRRIQRFLKDIQQPTLFIRYIKDEEKNGEGKLSELEYIERNHNQILKLLKSYNMQNEIIYIANEGISSNVIKIYNVEKDENDQVARRPLDKNEDLRNLLLSVEYDFRESNLEFYGNKKRFSLFKKFKKKIMNLIKSKVQKEYIHEFIIASSNE